MDEPVRVFVLDDHEIVRRGIVELLSNALGYQVVGEAGTLAEARAGVLATRPDVAILDARLPDGSGIGLCREIRSALPQTYCLILTAYDDEDALVTSILAGASGYLLKQAQVSELVNAIGQVARGRSLLSPLLVNKVVTRLQQEDPAQAAFASLSTREREVLGLIANGLTNHQIADCLFLSEQTIKNYVSTMLTKLGMQRRTQAAIFGTILRQQGSAEHE